MTPWAVLATGALVAAAGVLAVRWACLSPRSRRGRIVYADDAGETVNLFCHVHGVVGRPDRILRVHRPLTEFRPEEIKSYPAPGKPSRSEVAQLLGEAVLTAATFGTYPRLGYLTYSPPGGAERTVPVPLGQDAEALTIQWLNRLRAMR